MDQQTTLRVYCALMEEAKIRFDIINGAYRNEAHYPAAMVREICYLQFRLLCEIIALGCLVAHGDIPEAQAIGDTYEPGKIIKRLEQLNPHFYPQPVEPVRTSGGLEIAGRPDTDHLKKDELPALWGRTGDVLHRSPMVKMFKQMKSSVADHADIFEWSAKITGLLNCHWMTLVENKKGMLVSLSAEDTKRPAATVYDFSVADGKVNTFTVRVAK